jgi:hypothetical protein
MIYGNQTWPPPTGSSNKSGTASNRRKIPDACYTYIFEVTRHNGNMSDLARRIWTPEIDSSCRSSEVVITPKRWIIIEKFQLLNLHFWDRLTQSKYDRRRPTYYNTVNRQLQWMEAIAHRKYGTSERKIISEVAPRRPYFHCVGRPWKCMFNISNFSLMIYRSGVITTSNLQLLSISGVVAGRATSVILPLCRTT